MRLRHFTSHTPWPPSSCCALALLIASLALSSASLALSSASLATPPDSAREILSTGPVRVSSDAPHGAMTSSITPGGATPSRYPRTATTALHDLEFELGCDETTPDIKLGIQQIYEGGDCLPGLPGEPGNLVGFAFPRVNTVEDAEITSIKIFFVGLSEPGLTANLYIWADDSGQPVLPDDECGLERWKLIETPIQADSAFSVYLVEPPVSMDLGERLWIGVVYPLTTPGFPNWYIGRISGPSVPGNAFTNLSGDHEDWFDVDFFDYGQCYAVRAVLDPTNQPPVAAAGGPYSANEGDAIQFDGSGSHDPNGDPLSYNWEFGDGQVASGPAPTHTYASGGTYTVTLTVTDPGGLDHADDTSATINAAPFAGAGGPYRANEGATTQFDGSGSGDPDGDPLTYAWEFGDGTTGDGPAPTHVYATGGFYTITLTVTDPGGLADADTTGATINTTPVADPGGPYIAILGDPIQYDGTGSDDPDGDPLTYAWEFGDGSTADGVAPLHSYFAGGVFTVTLTVTDPDLLHHSAFTMATSIPPDTVVVGPAAGCITLVDTCRTAAVRLSHVSPTDVRAASITIRLGPELTLCASGPQRSIHLGDWLDAFMPAVFFAINDNGDGSYTIDQAILGEPCGAATGGTLFTVDLHKAPGFADSTGTLTVTEVLITDCRGRSIPAVAGPPQAFEIDTTPPPAITNLGANAILVGNDFDGTIPIRLTFDMPGSEVSVFELWRAPYGNQPEYDDPPNPGTRPERPSRYPPTLDDRRWDRLTIGTSGETDEPEERDFWYYIAATRDACGNTTYSAEMPGALNYHLGDVMPSSNPGNNLVNFFDISRLGACYFRQLLPGDLCAGVDVGPAGPDGPPLTDDVVNFYDLLVFATNYGEVSMKRAPGGAPALTDEDRLQEPALELWTEIDPAGSTRVRLLLVNHVDTIQALHAVVGLEDARAVEVERGKLLDAQPYEVFFIHHPGAKLVIDAAVLGRHATLAGAGEVASILITAEPGTIAPVAPRLLTFDLRAPAATALAADRAAEPPTAAIAGNRTDPSPTGSPLPTHYALLGARPNPFNPVTSIHFLLPEATRVDLRIYDVGGHLVRTLAHAVLPPGVHAIRWNGRNDQGRPLGSGVYLYAIRAGEIDAVEKLLLLK